MLCIYIFQLGDKKKKKSATLDIFRKVCREMHEGEIHFNPHEARARVEKGLVPFILSHVTGNLRKCLSSLEATSQEGGSDDFGKMSPIVNYDNTLLAFFYAVIPTVFCYPERRYFILI